MLCFSPFSPSPLLFISPSHHLSLPLRPQSICLFLLLAISVARSRLSLVEKASNTFLLTGPGGRHSANLVARSNCTIQNKPVCSFLLHSRSQHHCSPSATPSILNHFSTRQKQFDTVAIIIRRVCGLSSDFSFTSCFHVSGWKNTIPRDKLNVNLNRPTTSLQLYNLNSFLRSMGSS